MFPPVLVALILALVSLCVYYVFKPRPLRFLRAPPSPSFLLGNEYQLARREQVGDLEFEWTAKFGSAYRIAGCLGESILVLTDPKGIQHMMHGYRYPKTQTILNFGRLVAGTGLLGVEGTDHQRQRKVLNPAFSVPNIRACLPVFQANALKLSLKWIEEIGGEGEKVVDVNKPLASVALDIIGEAGFKHRFGSLDSHNNSDLTKVYENFFVEAKSHPEKWDILAQSFWRYIPSHVVPWMLHLPGRQYRRLRQHLDIAMATAAELLAAHAQDKVDLRDAADMLSILASAGLSKDPSTHLEDHEVKSQLTTMIIAGHETTSNTLSWLLYELARHPRVQEDLRREIFLARAQLSKKGVRDFTPQHLDDMRMLNAVIKETLRFHSMVPTVHRRATTNDVIPLAYPIRAEDGTILDGVPVRKGQAILVDIASHHRLPQLWGKDANEWNPYRFMQPEPDVKPSSGGVYAGLMTFWGGTFSCIGWRFAVLEMQTVISELVEKFAFRPPSPELEMIRTPAVTMQPTIRGQPDKGACMPLRIRLVDNE